MHLFLMRHPQTVANQQGLIYGKKDYPYTERGEKQIGQAVDNSSCFSFDHIFSSPIKRAGKLAEAVAEFHGLAIKYDARLEEMNQGVLEGLNESEAKERYPEVYEGLMSGDMSFGPPQGESFVQFKERVLNCLEALTQLEGNVLVVSHGGVIRTMIESVIDCEPGFSWQLDVGNGSIIEINLDKDYGRIRQIINIEEIN